MTKSSGKTLFVFSSSLLCCCLTLLLPLHAFPQQTLGGITGTVTDSSGGVLADALVTVVADATQLTRTQKTTSVGSYDFVTLPIGSYTLTFSHDGFESQRIPSIVVQADRTATLNTSLKVGAVGSTVTVEPTAPTFKFALRLAVRSACTTMEGTTSVSNPSCVKVSVYVPIGRLTKS